MTKRKPRDPNVEVITLHGCGRNGDELRVAKPAPERFRLATPISSGAYMGTFIQTEPGRYECQETLEL